MIYNVEIPGSDARIELKSSGFFTGARLLVDGQPAPKGAARGEFLVPAVDGGSVSVTLKTTFLDPTPALLVNGATIRVVEPFTWWEWIFVGAPFALIAGGGLIGGLIGGVVSSGNATLLRGELPQGAKIGLCALTTFVGLVGGFTLIFAMGVAVGLARGR